MTLVRQGTSGPAMPWAFSFRIGTVVNMGGVRITGALTSDRVISSGN